MPVQGLDARDYDELKGLGSFPPTPSVTGINILGSTLSRIQGFVGTVAIGATGVMMLTSIMLPVNVKVTNVHFVSGGTASAGAVSPHTWLALYTGNLKLMAQSTDDTATAAIGANTVYSKALTAPQITSYSGAYYVGISVTASTTVCTATGITQPTSAGLNGLTPILCGTTGSGLAGVAPNPAAALTASVSIPLMLVS